MLACSDQGLRQLPPTMTVTPTLLDFGEVADGASVVRSFTVTNDGPGALDVTGIEVAGGGFTVVQDDATGTLSAGESAVVQVAWAGGDAMAQGTATVSAAQTRGQQVFLVGSTPGGGEVAEGHGKGDDADDGVVIVGPSGETTASGTLMAAGGIDLAVLLDTTQSMQSLVDAVTGELAGIVEQLAAGDRDVRYGLATFEDYAVHPYGTAGADLPFRLRAPMGDDPAVMRAGLATVTIHQGQDAPEATMEALRQALTGVGWDADCDGRLDATTDVPPFLSGPTDAFGGGVAGVGSVGVGGMGFEAGRLPVVLYATNYELRDADDPRFTVPTGCPMAAGASDVADAARTLGARLVGIAVGLSEESYAFGQMQALARATSSHADIDGNGTAEPVVLRWGGSSADFRAQVVRGVEGLLGSLAWTDVRLEVDDPARVVRSVTPTAWSTIRAGQALDYAMQLRALPAGAEAVVTLRLSGTAPSGERELLDQQILSVRGMDAP